jgi:hypothetical protein
MFSKLPVPAELLNELEVQFAPPDHEVFQLTPPAFDQHASLFYNSLGRPQVSYDSFWDIYRQILHLFQVNEGQPEDMPTVSLANTLAEELDSHFDTIARISNEGVSLLPGMEELRQGGPVVGDTGDVGSSGPSSIPVAVFTDESGSEGDGDESF